MLAKRNCAVFSPASSANSAATAKWFNNKLKPGEKRDVVIATGESGGVFAMDRHTGEFLGILLCVVHFVGDSVEVFAEGFVEIEGELARRGLTTRMILTIHDELLFEGPAAEMDEVRAIAEAEMVAPWEDRTPPLAVDAGVGRTWLDAK